MKKKGVSILDMKSFILYLSERIVLIFATNVIFSFFAYLELYTPTIAYVVFLSLLVALVCLCVKVNQNIDMKSGLYYLSFPIAWFILKDFPLMDVTYGIFPLLETMNMSHAFTFTVTLYEISADLCAPLKTPS